MMYFFVATAVILLVGRAATSPTLESPEDGVYERSPAQPDFQNYYNLRPRQLACRSASATISAQPVSSSASSTIVTTAFSTLSIPYTSTTTTTTSTTSFAVCGHNYFRNPSFSGNDPSGASGPSLQPWTFDPRPDVVPPTYPPGRVTPFSFNLSIASTGSQKYSFLSQTLYVLQNQTYTMSFYYRITRNDEDPGLPYYAFHNELVVNNNQFYRDGETEIRLSDHPLNTWILFSETFNYSDSVLYDPSKEYVYAGWGFNLIASSNAEVHVTEFSHTC